MCAQVETGDPICWLSSANLVEVTPTFHIARFLPSIKDSKAPFTFALQVSSPVLHYMLPFLYCVQGARHKHAYPVMPLHAPCEAVWLPLPELQNCFSLCPSARKHTSLASATCTGMICLHVYIHRLGSLVSAWTGQLCCSQQKSLCPKEITILRAHSILLTATHLFCPGPLSTFAYNCATAALGCIMLQDQQTNRTCNSMHVSTPGEGTSQASSQAIIIKAVVV